MGMEGQFAVVDRIVDGVAVLLVGEKETEHHLPAERLPSGAQAGDWLQLDTDGAPVAVDAARTSQRRRELTRQRDRIRRDQSGGRF